MRPGLRLTPIACFAAFAVTCFAQWQHFGGNGTTKAVPDQAGPSSLAREMVAAHNAVRRRVGTNPLAWSRQLADVAQEWANKLMASGQFVHSHNLKYGENLFEITGAAATPADVIGAWAGEAKDYSYASNGCRAGAMCGHYTQVIWNDTREVGCAVARGGGREVWVCEYNPPGNWVGRKPY